MSLNSDLNRSGPKPVRVWEGEFTPRGDWTQGEWTGCDQGRWPMTRRARLPEREQVARRSRPPPRAVLLCSFWLPSLFLGLNPQRKIGRINSGEWVETLNQSNLISKLTVKLHKTLWKRLLQLLSRNGVLRTNGVQIWNNREHSISATWIVTRDSDPNACIWSLFHSCPFASLDGKLQEGRGHLSFPLILSSTPSSMSSLLSSKRQRCKVGRVQPLKLGDLSPTTSVEQVNEFPSATHPTAIHHLERSPTPKVKCLPVHHL